VQFAISHSFFSEVEEKALKESDLLLLVNAPGAVALAMSSGCVK
jgi:hypothetical protein